MNGKIIATTEDHPFWSVTDQRFERADHLANGEFVLTADNQVVEVLGLKDSTRRRAIAYNLSVQGVHTFHVGEHELLVHNTCKIYADGSPDGRSSASGQIS